MSLRIGFVSSSRPVIGETPTQIFRRTLSLNKRTLRFGAILGTWSGAYPPHLTHSGMLPSLPSIDDCSNGRGGLFFWSARKLIGLSAPQKNEALQLSQNHA